MISRCPLKFRLTWLLNLQLFCMLGSRNYQLILIRQALFVLLYNMFGCRIINRQYLGGIFNPITTIKKVDKLITLLIVDWTIVSFLAGLLLHFWLVSLIHLSLSIALTLLASTLLNGSLWLHLILWSSCFIR